MLSTSENSERKNTCTFFRKNLLKNFQNPLISCLNMFQAPKDNFVRKHLKMPSIDFLRNRISELIFGPRFAEEPPSSYGTITYDLLFRGKDKRLFTHFSDWQKEFSNREKNYRKSCEKQSLKTIKKLNSVRKGSKYIKNTPGYLIEVKGASK